MAQTRPLGARRIRGRILRHRPNLLHPSMHTRRSPLEPFLEQYLLQHESGTHYDGYCKHRHRLRHPLSTNAHSLATEDHEEAETRIDRSFPAGWIVSDRSSQETECALLTIMPQCLHYQHGAVEIRHF